MAFIAIASIKQRQTSNQINIHNVHPLTNRLFTSAPVAEQTCLAFIKKLQGLTKGKGKKKHILKRQSNHDKQIMM